MDIFVVVSKCRNRAVLEHCGESGPTPTENNQMWNLFSEYKSASADSSQPDVSYWTNPLKLFIMSLREMGQPRNYSHYLIILI